MNYEQRQFWRVIYENVIASGFSNEVALQKANQAAIDILALRNDENQEDEDDDPN